METLWTFKTKRFEIHWGIEDPDFLELSWTVRGGIEIGGLISPTWSDETARKIESGEWTAFNSSVVVYLDGVPIGADHLGGSVCENPADFRDHFGIAHTGRVSYFSDMVREAIRCARQFIASVPA
jgi:hypothetical protein